MYVCGKIGIERTSTVSSRDFGCGMGVVEGGGGDFYGVGERRKGGLGGVNELM